MFQMVSAANFAKGTKTVYAFDGRQWWKVTYSGKLVRKSQPCPRQQVPDKVLDQYDATLKLK